MICIDPGLRGVGMAVFRGKELWVAQYVKNPAPGRGYAAHRALAKGFRTYCVTSFDGPLIIEHPRVYPGMPKTDLNDLLDVVGVGSAIASILVLEDVQTVFPSEWKGNLKKQAMLERIRSKLSPDELGRCEFTNKSDNEDLLDAVGIGLWKLGRLNRTTYPGAVP